MAKQGGQLCDVRAQHGAGSNALGAHQAKVVVPSPCPPAIHYASPTADDPKIPLSDPKTLPRISPTELWISQEELGVRGGAVTCAHRAPGQQLKAGCHPASAANEVWAGSDASRRSVSSSISSPRKTPPGPGVLEGGLGKGTRPSESLAKRPAAAGGCRGTVLASQSCRLHGSALFVFYPHFLFLVSHL